METEEVEKILAHTLKSTYVGVCAKDELPKTKLRPLAIIVNSDPSSQPGTHWMAIYLHRDGRGKFFDSYGRYPPPFILTFLRKQTEGEWSYNGRALQSTISTFCEAYCLLYLHARNSDRRLPSKTGSSAVSIQESVAERLSCAAADDGTLRCLRPTH